MTHVSDVVAPYFVQQLASERTQPIVPLLEVIELNPRKFSRPPADDDLVSFVPMKAVEEESGRLDPSEARPWSEVRKGYTPFEEGDVIFAKITPCMENGKYALAQGLVGGRAAGSTEFHVLRHKPSLDSKYLLYFLLRAELRQSARQSMRGAAGQLRVPPIFFESLSIPLPSLDEQHRIVAEIEEQLSRLEAGVAALKRVQANLKRYRASVLSELCKAHCEDLPPGWVRKTLGELTTVVRGGSPRPAGDPKYFGGTIPWITVGPITASIGKYLTSVPEGVTEEGKARSRYIAAGTLLLTNSGATLGVPKITAIDGCINDGVAALLDVDEPLKSYLLHFLTSQTDGLRGTNQGAAQPNLNTTIIKAISVPLPPLNQIPTIVAEVERRLSVVEELETQVRADLARAERLRQAVLASAFASSANARQ